MRYEPDTFELHQPLDETAVAWLESSAILAPPPVGVNPARAAPDVPGAVGGMIVASYVALIGALYVVTAGSAQSIFAIAIAAIFVAVFFAVPRIFLAMEAGDERRPALAEFMDSGMQTLTGHASGAAALVQMLVVPVLLTLAVLAIGVITALG